MGPLMKPLQCPRLGWSFGAQLLITQLANYERQQFLTASYTQYNLRSSTQVARRVFRCFKFRGQAIG